jgi:type VI protein secretion system component VasF
MKYVALALGAAVAVVAIRAILMRTLAARLGGQREQAALEGAPASMRTRLSMALAWPVFFLMVAAVLVLGVLVGSLLAPR